MDASLDLRDYTFLGTTQSLCPECRGLVNAKIITRGGRVYFRKRCPQHGQRDEFVCSDVRFYDRHELNEPGKVPRLHATESSRGCPFDCGLCPEHEQHTCVGLIEVTSSCNLTCPLCYAESGPGGSHLRFEDYARTVDRFVEQEGEPDVLQLSGGEPTVHPEILRMVRYACERPIRVVMINTNGLKLASDPRLVEGLAELRDRVEIYLQLDGLRPETHSVLRGEPLLETKLRALEALAEHGLRSTLVCTVQHRVNLDQVGELVRFGLERSWVRGVSFQPASYVGRHMDPRCLEERVTLPDVVKALVAQCGGLFREEDFLPVPCAHPNCHLMTYLYRGAGPPMPITRLLDFRRHADLLANTLVYTPAKARALVGACLDREGGCCGPPPAGGSPPPGLGFVEAALAEKLTGKDVFRITLTAFLDKHIFDVRRVMKCCIAFLLPSGHTIPFCAYNTLYRDGHVPLPPLRR